MIEITKTLNADSRTARADISTDDLIHSTEDHIDHVRMGLLYFREKLLDAANDHDNTKLAHMNDFYEALTSGKVKDSRWYRMHTTEERHHLLTKAPEDVNLIDVLEHMTDCVMAGMARSGEIYDIELSSELLQLAHKNTVELLKSQIKVKEVCSENEHEDNNE